MRNTAKYLELIKNAKVYLINSDNTYRDKNVSGEVRIPPDRNIVKGSTIMSIHKGIIAVNSKNGINRFDIYNILDKVNINSGFYKNRICINAAGFVILQRCETKTAV